VETPSRGSAPATIFVLLLLLETPTMIRCTRQGLGGAMTDKDKPYTAEALSDLVQNIKDATTPEKK